jgi:hypothetical protein
VNIDITGGQCELSTLASEVVSALAIDMHGGPCRGSLSDGADELLQAVGDAGQCGQRIRCWVLLNLSCCVVRVAGLSEGEAGEIGFGQQLQNSDKAGGVTDADQQDTGGWWIQRSGVPGAQGAYQSLDAIDGIA